jgi:hypothetical protein
MDEFMGYKFHYFDYVTLLMTIIFLYGCFYDEPVIFIQINFCIKVAVAIYLMYRFHDFKRVKTITMLDQKICSFGGFYLFIFSFADVVTIYLKQIREYILTTYSNLFLTNTTKDDVIQEKNSNDEK